MAQGPGLALDSQPHKRTTNGVAAHAFAPSLPAEVVGKILSLTGENATFIARVAVLGRAWRDAVEWLDHLGKWRLQMRFLCHHLTRERNVSSL